MKTLALNCGSAADRNQPRSIAGPRWLRLLVFLAGAVAALAQPSTPPVQPATQPEVNAGTVKNKYVSPATLMGWSGATNYPVGIITTNVITVTNVNGTSMSFSVASGSCIVFTTTNGIGYQICLSQDGSRFYMSQIGPILVHSDRMSFYSNGLTVFHSVPFSAAGALTNNLRWLWQGPANEGSPVWDGLATNTGWTGLGTKFRADDGTYKTVTVTAVITNDVHVTNITVTNLTVLTQIRLKGNDLFPLAEGEGIRMTTNTSTSVLTVHTRYSTNLDATADNFVSLHTGGEVQVTHTNALATGVNQTNTVTLTNLTQGAHCSFSFYGATAPSTNYVKFRVPSGSALRWLSTTNGSSDFSVTSNKVGVASFWCDRATNVMACYRESQ